MSTHALGTLVVVTLIAAAAALITSRIPRQLVPVIVIELALGFLAGPSGLGLIQIMTSMPGLRCRARSRL
ncbi:MAG: hypothetical protein HY574_02660 [candidate division NC10 bacterium]|nr:hypothetical protein [candidate division NC10 bacterium]